MKYGTHGKIWNLHIMDREKLKEDICYKMLASKKWSFRMVNNLAKSTGIRNTTDYKADYSNNNNTPMHSTLFRIENENLYDLQNLFS
jgi:hypothetical protein